jgi:glycosyltransferase involved in cell wall biosynthesis
MYKGIMYMDNFSVLIPVYKRDNLKDFKDSFESISTYQTTKPSQIVISIDGPVVRDLEVYIRELEKNEMITCVWSSINHGLGTALNKGLEECKFDIVARMDSDDVAHPTRFEKQLKLIESNDLISSNLAEFSESIDRVESFRKAMSKELISKNYWVRNPFNHPSVMFRKSAVLRAGGYIHMPFFEDWYLWIRVIAQGASFDNINEPLVYFRSDMRQLKRRRGLTYLKHEIHFVRKLKRQEYISSIQLFTRVAISMIFRLLPVRAFKFITKFLLRK